ncbi:hypothetical protein DY000_02017061 [Brassica cretica]|uniref:Uncharacterized protein n=1 Tax=Brassica cretica TaxID=69181 RepID=A0ABQ7D7V3_BRACR|nr:hypothetical protein DY000_02017061 [Brassica cretica]
MLTREDMAVMLRLNLMSHRATLEGRELTGIEIRMAQQLKEDVKLSSRHVFFTRYWSVLWSDLRCLEALWSKRRWKLKLVRVQASTTRVEAPRAHLPV